MRVFWVALFVLVACWLSSPFYGPKVGPVNFAYSLVLIYLVRSKFRFTIYIVPAVLYILLSPVIGQLVISSFCISACNSFFGAGDPLLYGYLQGFRLILAILVISYCTDHKICSPETVVVCCRFLIVGFFCASVIQSLAFYLGFTLGSIFPSGGLMYGSLRFDALYGEPNHVHSWLVPACGFLIFTRASGYKLYCLLGIAVLVWSFSLAWSIVFVSLLFLTPYQDQKLQQRKYSFIIVSSLLIVSIAAFYKSMDVGDYGKIALELGSLNERSGTVIAAFEILKDHPMFGYGIGYSPYLLINTDLFLQNPSINLSHLGRQNVMSTPVQIVGELGLVGFFLTILALARYFRFLWHYRLIGLAALLSLPYLAVGSGLVAIPHLLTLAAIPALVKLRIPLD